MTNATQIRPNNSTADFDRQIADLRHRLAQLEDDSAEADTIPQFCARHRISKAFYYLLKAQGRAPREMRLGPNGRGAVRITRTAQADWPSRARARS